MSISTYVQDLSKTMNPEPVQYLQSSGSSVDVTVDDTDGKVSAYFYPSMVFPKYMEIVSATIMYSNNKAGSTDKTIQLATGENGGSHNPYVRPEYKIIHKAGELATTLNFNPPLILDPHQPFYFYSAKEELLDSCLVLGYRFCNKNFGNRTKTPFKV